MSKPPMDDYARSLLEQFAKAANLSNGVASLHPLDWDRFYEFIIHVYMRRLPIGGEDVISALFGYGVTSETASRLGGWFDRARKLLQLYDQRRA